MRKIALVIEYDGTNYYGWQKQKDPNQKSVQTELEKALKEFFGVPIIVGASGRTDRGVHAAGQVVDFKFYNKLYVRIEKLHKVLNNYLPNDIKVKSAQFVKLGFSSRFYAESREYSYTLSTKDTVFNSQFEAFVPYKLDIDLLNQSASKFIGIHDFTSFSKHNRDTKSYVCDVEKSHWVQLEEYKFKYYIKANRFVYSMVRSLVGFMIDVGRSKRSQEEIEDLYNNPRRDFTSALASPKGLVLEKVYYSDQVFNDNLNPYLDDLEEDITDTNETNEV